MRGWAAMLAALLALAACGHSAWENVPGHPEAQKSAAAVRAARRLYDGAPPVIPHKALGAACLSCHNGEGVAVAGLGFAPPFPHGQTAEPARFTRCEQCHVYRTTEKVFHRNTFAGLSQDLRRGGRLYATAPPVIPHALFLREDCLACHGGPAAREAIRTTHPERIRCRQCHAAQATTAVFRPRS